MYYGEEKRLDKYMDMKRYGLSDQLINCTQEFEGLTVSRITSQEKGIYCIIAAKGEKQAKISGKFRYQTRTISELPAVGDFVMTDWNEQGGNAVIHHVLPRKSCFTRKAAGDARNEQVVAANIDTVFLCMSLNNDFHLRRLERYLSVAWDSSAVPVVVLTKADLCTDLEHRLYEVSTVAMRIEILVTTAVEENGYQQICPYILEGKTVAFIGSSGVGKSTLINCLLGEKRLETNGLRNDDKGRHTTTHRELILLPNGGMVIDTPGMRELGMWDAGEGIDRTFADIEKISDQCRFHNCTHSVEPGCAIQKALDDGVISIDRWQSYQKLKAENAYAQDSKNYLAAKEKKFKDIAKYNKINRKKRPF